MRLAFLTYENVACTGRQRALQFLLGELRRRGHECRVYSASPEGSPPDGVDWRRVSAGPFGEVRRRRRFLARAQADLAERPVDVVVGLDPCPGLDAYLSLQAPYPVRTSALHGPLYRLGPRYRFLAERERALFEPGSETRVLLPAASLLDDYHRLYATPRERLHLLPPGLGDDRQLPDDAAGRRKTLRGELALESGDYALLFVAGDFNAGGLERVMKTLAHIREEQPAVRSVLLVAGPDRPGRFRALARRLKLVDEVRFLGAREDIVDLMLAADLLVYPAVVPSAGSVLLEAVALGLPSFPAAPCGHAQHVKDARAGILLESPFSQEQLDRAVMRFMDGIFRADCRESGRRYARMTDLSSMYREAADLLEGLFSPRG
jgi:UDP-glucose:(heptosyl)LPS alpha-1,3-glucosyltransferase